MDDLMRGKELYLGTCARCGREGLKRNMTTLNIKVNRAGRFLKLCHLCPRCLPELLDFLAVSMPE